MRSGHELSQCILFYDQTVGKVASEILSVGLKQRNPLLNQIIVYLC